jgi:hypothetical protein
MSSLRLDIRVDSEELRKTLEALPRNVSEAVRKRVSRRVTKPYVADLAAAWLRTQFKGPDAKHRIAIAAAMESDVRRQGSGDSATIRTRIGVKYGTGAKAASVAKGRQKVWHLLEYGFRHYGSGSAAYVSAGPELLAQQKQQRAFVRTQADALWKQIPGRGRRDKQARREGFQRIFAAARAAFPELTQYKQGRKETMAKIRAGSAKNIIGRAVSMRWGRANLARLVDELARETLAEAKRVLAKGPKP